MCVHSLNVKLVVRIALQTFEDIWALYLRNGNVFIVIAFGLGILPVVYIVMQHCVAQGPRCRPIQHSVFCADRFNVDVGRRARKHTVSLQQTVGVLPHVTQTLEEVEIDVGDVPRAQLLAQVRQPPRFTAGRMVDPVRQTRERVRCPRGADHQVRYLGLIGDGGVAQFAQARFVRDAPLRAAASYVRQFGSFARLLRVHVLRG